MELPVPKNEPSSSSSMVFLKCRLQQLTVGAVMSVFLPRLGPGRALWIALRSRLFSLQPYHYSIRPQIENLKNWICQKSTKQAYTVIIGEKLVGKTCLIDTAVNKMAGVIRIRAYAGDSESTINERVMLQLTNINKRINGFSPFHSGRRVVFWFTIFFRRPPTVVICATDRARGKQYAELSSAVRTLTEDYKLRVIVDGSRNSVDSSVLGTGRQRIMWIEPMSQEMIRSIPELSLLLGLLKEAKLQKTVFEVIGGRPYKYFKLQTILTQSMKYEVHQLQSIRQKICVQLLKEVNYACDQVERFLAHKPISRQHLFAQFKQNGYLSRQTLYPNSYQDSTRRSVDDIQRIFKKVCRDGLIVRIPRQKATQIAIKNNLNQIPDFDVLQKLI